MDTVQTDTFLSHSEIVDLTGYKAGSKQCQQLRQQGIPFFVNARGYPRVSRGVIETRQAKPSSPAWQPKIKVQAA